MSDITEIRLPDSSVHKIKDEKAWQNLAANEESGAKNKLNGASAIPLNASNSGGLITNTLADSRNYIDLYFMMYNGSTLLTSVQLDPAITAVGDYSYNVIIPNGTTHIVVKHNGASVDSGADYALVDSGACILSLTILGADPSTIGGMSFNNVMLRDARILDPTFAPYAPTNRELMSYKANGKVGAKNLNSYPYYEGSKVENGITWIVNSNGSVTVSGIATGLTYIELHNRSPQIPNTCILKAGTYILTGGLSSKVSINIDQRNPSGSYTPIGTDFGSGLTFTIVSDVEFPDAARIGLSLVVESGTDLSTPVTIYPMIRIAEDTDPTFVPYAKTNRELTDDLSIKTALISEIYNPLLLNYARVTYNKMGFVCVRLNGCKNLVNATHNALFTLPSDVPRPSQDLYWNIPVESEVYKIAVAISGTVSIIPYSGVSLCENIVETVTYLA